MRIELLYFKGCPTWGPTLERLSQVLAEERIAQQVDVIEISTQADAERHKFLGSPTVRLDGRDIDSAVWQRTDYGFGCRIYQEAGTVVSGVPSKEMIRRAVRAAAGQPGSIEQAQEEVLDAIKRQHPGWVGPGGECPRCVSYEYELADASAQPKEE